MPHLTVPQLPVDIPRCRTLWTTCLFSDDVSWPALLMNGTDDCLLTVCSLSCGCVASVSDGDYLKAYSCFELIIWLRCDSSFWDRWIFYYLKATVAKTRCNKDLKYCYSQCNDLPKKCIFNFLKKLTKMMMWLCLMWTLLTVRIQKHFFKWNRVLELVLEKWCFCFCSYWTQGGWLA